MEKNAQPLWPLSTAKTLFLLLLILHSAYRLTDYSAAQSGFYYSLALLLVLLSTLFRPEELNQSLTAFLRQPWYWRSAPGLLVAAAIGCLGIGVVLALSH